MSEGQYYFYLDLLTHKNVNPDALWVLDNRGQVSDVVRSCCHTSYCKTNKYFIKVPLIIDGGHLAAVLCSVWASGVEDQNVGWLSELCSVLQVPFWEEKKHFTIAHSYTQHDFTVQKQDSMPSSFKVLFIQLSSESWDIALKSSGPLGW